MPLDTTFTRKVFIATIIPLAVIAIVFLISRTAAILLVFFLGVLYALFLRAGADLVAYVTRLPVTWSLAIFLLLLIALMLLFGWLAVPQIADQLGQLGERLPSAIRRIESQLRSVPWLERVMEEIPEAIESAVQQQQGFIGQIQRVFSVTLASVAGIAVILIVGIYLAARPRLYVNTFVQLFPVNRRGRMIEVIERLAHVLRMWLVGRAIGMTFVGLLTGFGLLWLGVPLPLALGFIAAVLDFVPNIGPIIAAAPAIVIAMTENLELAAYVVLLYIAVQELEAYLITPLIEQKVVQVAPAFNIVMQIILTILFGFLGLLLATPLMVILMVLIQELYIKDVLEAVARNRQAEANGKGG